jgi:hypothetical protein
VHLHRSRLCKSSKHGNLELKIAKGGKKKERKEKNDSKIKIKCVIDEIVNGNHDWKLRVEITDVKLIRACVSCMVSGVGVGGGGGSIFEWICADCTLIWQPVRSGVF